MSFPSLPVTPRVRAVRFALSQSMICAGIYLFLTDGDEPGWRNILATCLVAGGWHIHPGSLAEAGVPRQQQRGLVAGARQDFGRAPAYVRGARFGVQVAAVLTYGLTRRRTLQSMQLASLGGFIQQLQASSFGRSRYVIPGNRQDDGECRLIGRYNGNLLFSYGMEVGATFVMRSNAMHLARALYGGETVHDLQSWSEPAEMVMICIDLGFFFTLAALYENADGIARFHLGLLRGLSLVLRAVFSVIPRSLSAADSGIFMLFWCANTALMERIWLPRDRAFPFGFHTFPYPLQHPQVNPAAPPQIAPPAVPMLQVAPLPPAPLIPQAMAPHPPLMPLQNAPAPGIAVVLVAPAPHMHAAPLNVPDFKRRNSASLSRSQSQEGKYGDDAV